MNSGTGVQFRTAVQNLSVDYQIRTITTPDHDAPHEETPKQVPEKSVPFKSLELHSPEKGVAVGN